jgi:hypothetical protein
LTQVTLVPAAMVTFWVSKAKLRMVTSVDPLITEPPGLLHKDVLSGPAGVCSEKQATTISTANPVTTIHA